MSSLVGGVLVVWLLGAAGAWAVLWAEAERADRREERDRRPGPQYRH